MDEESTGERTKEGRRIDGYRRYAVYYAPEPDTALAAFGAAWLGWDAETRAERAHPALPGLPRPVADLTAAPRRYGFHGTLKAPFRLAPGRTPAELDAALAALAAAERAFELPPLRLEALGPFLAIVPAAPAPRLDAIAATCVAAIDAFRAPLGPEERARRAEGLSPAQRRLLDRWGYPFVMEEFRFHLTLTGPLETPDRDATAVALDRVLAPILAERQCFSSLCLFGEPATGPFHLLRCHKLTG
jgi:putative phosphonate metabolism protein